MKPQSNAVKKDYRKGTRPEQRKVESQGAIIKVLAYGEANFGKLMEMTGLCKPALSSNLKELQGRGLAESRVDPEDFRKTIYSLNVNGINEYEKLKDLESLRDMEFQSVGELLSIIKGAMIHMMDAVTLLFESPELHGIRDGQKVILTQKEKIRFPRLRKKEREILENCLSISVYSGSKEKDNVPFIGTFEEFVAVVKLLASSEKIDPQRLERLKSLTFMFQLKKEDLIEQYEKLKK